MRDSKNLSAKKSDRHVKFDSNADLDHFLLPVDPTIPARPRGITMEYNQLRPNLREEKPRETSGPSKDSADFSN